MTIPTNCTNRKEMVNKLAAMLGEDPIYNGPPSFGYTVGHLTIDRDANISAEDPADLEAVKPWLIENGYIDADEAAAENDVDLIPELEVDEPEKPDELPEEETSDSEAISMCIGFPYDIKPVSMLKNLVFILYSKQTLLNHATGNDTLKIPDAAIEALKGREFTTHDELISTLVPFRDSGEMHGLTFEDAKVYITYGELPDTDWYNTFLHLTMKMMEAAEAAKRVFPDHQQPESEKYVMRSWLVRMGMGGPEWKAIRQILLKNLTGHSAFPTEAAAQKHREKYAQIRKDLREAGESHAE